MIGDLRQSAQPCARQRLCQDVVLDPHLEGVACVLVLAPAAGAEVNTARRHAIRRAFRQTRTLWSQRVSLEVDLDHLAR